jgi:alkaline phosphatase D
MVPWKETMPVTSYRIRRIGPVIGVLLAAVSVGFAQQRARTAQPKQAKPQKKGVGQYKRIGREMLTTIAKGEPAKAIRSCEKFLADWPDDLETMYCLAIAYARTGELGKATATASKALDAGLPPGRFIAGPRDLLKPLAECPGFRELMKSRSGELIHGPLLGSVTDERVRIWVRTAGETTVQAVLRSEKKGDQPIRSATVKTAATRDFTAVVEATGLRANERYTYELLVGGKATKLDPPPSFRTFPKRGEKCRFRIVFGGGAGYTPQYEHMWNTLAGRKPTAFLAMGDNVYIDTPTVPATQRYCYYRRQSRPEWRRFVASVPVFSIWDDHDFAANDCVGSAGIDDIPWKLPVWRVFQENWANPSYGGGRAAPGIWYDFNIGDVDFFMLDGRYYRVRPKAKGRGKAATVAAKPSPEPTMLGPVQEKWLLTKLAASKATFKVLASPVPWAEGTKGGSKDTWDGFAEQRERIFSHIADKRIEGVYLISADRHRSDAWKTERPGAYPLYEANSSRLTNIHTHAAVKGSLFSYNKKCSFALLTFDTTKADPEIRYDVVTIDNEVMHTLTVKRSEISFQKSTR